MPYSKDKGLVIRQYNKGIVVFSKGDEAQEAYLVREGRVRIFQKDENGKERDIGFAEQGDILGEMSMFQKKKRTSYAEAVEKSNLVIISRELFDEKVNKADPLLSAIIGGLIKRLYKAQNKNLA